MDVAADHEPRPLLFDCGEQRLRSAMFVGHLAVVPAVGRAVRDEDVDLVGDSAEASLQDVLVFAECPARERGRPRRPCTSSPSISIDWSTKRAAQPRRDSAVVRAEIVIAPRGDNVSRRHGVQPFAERAVEPFVLFQPVGAEIAGDDEEVACRYGRRKPAVQIGKGDDRPDRRALVGALAGETQRTGFANLRQRSTWSPRAEPRPVVLSVSIVCDPRVEVPRTADSGYVD